MHIHHIEISDQRTHLPEHRALLTHMALLLLLLATIAVTISADRGGATAMSTSGNRDSAGAPDAALAVITNSGSTNTPGFTLTIAHDGSGTLTYKQSNNQRFASYQDKHFPAGTFSASQFSSQLQAAGDVSNIPSGHCMKSASFGTRTTITYAGKTSGDLSCPNASDTPAHLQLKLSVLQLVNQAK